jgi:sulfopyruvate decarboxylase subunit alpha
VKDRIQRKHGQGALGDMADWQLAIAAEIAAAGVEVVAYVPDSRLWGVVKALDGRVGVRTLTREEECVGFAAGYRAAGGRPLVMLQSSGLGNCLNAIGSLAVPYGLSFPMIVSMRGTLGEQNPSQVPIGRATAKLLDAFGIQAYSLLHPRDVSLITSRVITLAQKAGVLAAVMLEPTLEVDDGHR